MNTAADTQPFAWWRRASPMARRALIAAALGWMLDSFDVMIFPLVQKSVMADLRLGAETVGWLQSLTLLSAAAGGLAFGVFADRFGRVRAMMYSMLLYSLFTAACGLATSATDLAVYRAGLGLGMGGEWASGAALVSEMWPERDRGKALGFMQSSWAIGYGLATLANWIVQDVAGLSWRWVFYAGLLPALLTIWVRRQVEEPPAWNRAPKLSLRAAAGKIFGGPLLRVTLVVTLMNACTLFAWWGFNSWVPTYLSSTPAKGGIGLSLRTMTALVVFMQAGMWLGYVSFGYIGDAIGRKRTYVAYLLLAAVMISAFTLTRNPWVLLALGPPTAFFATGYFSGFGAVTADIYPTEIRATAQGFTYNLGRVASAFAPFALGGLAANQGFAAAFSVTALAFLAAAACWMFIPETRKRQEPAAP